MRPQKWLIRRRHNSVYPGQRALSLRNDQPGSAHRCRDWARCYIEWILKDPESRGHGVCRETRQENSHGESSQDGSLSPSMLDFWRSAGLHSAILIVHTSPVGIPYHQLPRLCLCRRACRRLKEGQHVCVDCFRVGCAHSVREARIHF